MYSALALLLLLAAPQPIPYSHKMHLALGLQCKNCHTNPDPGEMMGFPATKTCMGCHATVKTESPAIQKLTQFAKDQKPVPWLRVYQIPGYVYFSHRSHQEAGANCQTCHGPIAQREFITKEVETSMGTCMDCHRKNKASIDCAYCHEQKQ